MASNEQSVRDAALAFKMAIDAAQAAGYRVIWPGNADGLDKIAISETGAVIQPEVPAAPMIRKSALKSFTDSDR